MTHLYKRAFTDKQFAVASAEAVIVFAVLMAFSVTYSILLRRRGD
jgi:ABC-type sugar transport system permease subunit